MERLGNFADELDDPDVDFFCEVLALNRETGSALSPMLASLHLSAEFEDAPAKFIVIGLP